MTESSEPPIKQDMGIFLRYNMVVYRYFTLVLFENSSFSIFLHSESLLMPFDCSKQCFIHFASPKADVPVSIEGWLIFQLLHMQTVHTYYSEVKEEWLKEESKVYSVILNLYFLQGNYAHYPMFLTSKKFPNITL